LDLQELVEALPLMLVQQARMQRVLAQLGRQLAAEFVSAP